MNTDNKKKTRKITDDKPETKPTLLCTNTQECYF